MPPNETNPTVEGLLGSLGGDGPSPELAGFMGGAPPPVFEPLPPPGPVARALNKTEQKTLLQESRAGTEVVAGMKKFGELAKLVDSGARVRVRKRLLNGQLSHIDDYSRRDVEFSGDVESFLNKWIKPQRGGGTYEVSLIDQKGTEYHAGIYTLDGPDIDPAKGPASLNGGSSASDFAMAGILRDLLNKPQPLPPDPFEQMKKVQEFMDMTNGGGKGNDFLAMMMQQNQQMMMAMLQKPAGPDPQIVELLNRMDRRLDKLEQVPPPPPPPPPMAPSGPSYSVPELITAAASAIAAIVPLVKGDPGIRPLELMQLMQTNAAQASAAMQAALGDRLTAKDVLEMQRRDADKQTGPATVVEQFQQLALVKQFAAELNPPPPGPQGTTFWDALVTLAGNQQLAESLGKRIEKSENAAPRALPVQIEDHGSPTEQPQAEPAQPPRFPPNFPELCKAIDDAQHDGARVDAVLEVIKALQPYPAWQPFVVGLLRAVAADDRAIAVRGLRQWFDMLVKNNLVSAAGADRTMATFEKHFPMIREEVLTRAPQLRPPAVTTPAPAPAPAAPAPVQAAQPSAPESAEDEEPEEPTKPTGPAPVILGDELEQAISNPY